MSYFFIFYEQNMKIPLQYIKKYDRIYKRSEDEGGNMRFS